MTSPAHRLRRRIARAALVVAAAVLLWHVVLAWQIIAAARTTESAPADVAIVLGAAVSGETASPVFEARLHEAVALYRETKARKLLFTGGLGPGTSHAESEVGRAYAEQHGVPATDILTETASHTTRQNLLEARGLMEAHGLSTALIVSDPLHLKRALRMAADLGIQASPAPARMTAFRSWRTKLPFLLRELYFYDHYLVFGE